MGLAPGTPLGPYEVVSMVRAGGMGEVYRARDTRLKRDVAIKVLPDTFASDPERLARFQREAEVLAALNHPHIAQIHGVEETAPLRALVMEFVEGEDLADRIARGPLPLDEALPIAKQIAEALEAAHEQGIIHRDLKPANIKITPAGTVKVLDFGLAKLADAPAPTASSPSVSSTITSPAIMTHVGILLGTAAYMSPEQVKGRTADRRSDVWAFGCIVFEMITGRKAFAGESIADTLSAALTREPDWSTLPAATPPPIRRMLRRCLQKNPARRMRHLGDAAIEIDEADGGESESGSDSHRPLRWPERAAWIAAVVALSVTALLFASRVQPKTDLPAEMRVEITTPATSEPASFAISPDARALAFVASDGGRPKLWLRSLGQVSARPVPGTDGATFPFWSPNGRSIAFFADDSRLKRVDVEDGAVRILSNAPLHRGGSWGRDDVILFAPASGPIFRIPAAGGPLTPVTTITPPQTAHAFPQFLPDNKHFVFYATGTPDVRGVYIAALDGTEQRRLTDSDSLKVVSAQGHLLLLHDGTLYAQQLDPDRLTLTGKPQPVASAIAVQPVTAFQVAAVGATDQGHLLYRSGRTLQQRQFVWFDRTGKEVRKVGYPDNASPNGPAISPDGKRIALHRMVDGNVDIWFLDVDRGSLTRFTTHVANEIHPLWSPDGRRILFSSNRTGAYELYEKSTVGNAEEKQILPTVGWPTDWSSDGGVVLFQPRSLKTNSDIWAIPYGTNRKPYPLVETEFEEREAQFSPDGKWIAYSSVESGRSEIYVQSFPTPGERRLVSIEGGAQPRWRRDGKELFFIGLDGRLMAVPMLRAANGETVEAGRPVPLFSTRVGGAVQTASRQTYIVSPDGSRFLMNSVVEDAAASPITMILNWRPR